jgi:hypothetical protein
MRNIGALLGIVLLMILGSAMVGLSIWNLAQDKCEIDVCNHSNDMIACFEISGVVVCDDPTPVTYSSCSEYDQINHYVFRCVASKTNTTMSLYAPSKGERYDGILGDIGILISIFVMIVGFCVCAGACMWTDGYSR